MLEVKSKSYQSFGCCAFWKQCDLGKGTCHYEVSYPAKMNVCGAYNRHQNAKVQKTPELVSQDEIVEDLQNETELILSDDGQLSLF